MKKSLLLIILYCLRLSASNFSFEEQKIIHHFYAPPITQVTVPDWHNPTFDDYASLQKFIKARLQTIVEKPENEKCFDGDLDGWITYRLGRLQLVATPDTPPHANIIKINNKETASKCIICYAGYNVGNRDYIQAIHYMINILKKLKFDGHFFYRIGGWPSLKRGRLQYVDVPYAFKPFMFEEARDLGYKQILWLDCAAMPVKDLTPIFDFIQTNGCCFFSFGKVNHRKLQLLAYVVRSLNASDTLLLEDILTQVVGIDTQHPQANRLLNQWLAAAERRVPFLEPSADQFSFAILVHKLGLLKGKLPSNYYLDQGPGNFSLQPHTIFLHQYSFLDNELTLPEEIKRRKHHFLNQLLS